ncbi:5-amino-6-(5-phospho-D-ribitylamino)uracil phosphatase YigB [Vibrio viridaestus]|uniref:5-amino-6-(5-phospho-D-ribitylamino)uracil phosphatase YigB n=1 Tax=Vibrio viridaestus TaxID=2487322 RepID=A0A3N9TBE8_9VIBR|nr:5-amino-6-(5-phospho-D-ribitylamino)uracil phosphatase YigB [Vibrio viridaestus]RQW61477.1 5-amino-6-(5-phospho-D-ribitylamino)uracil phosphatase YigB [Vibrio viridaestus]
MHFFRRLPEIKAMTFDLDDTLYNNRPVIQYLEQQFRQWMGQNHPVTNNQPEGWWLAVKKEVAIKFPDLIHDVTLWRHKQVETGLMSLGYGREQAVEAADSAIAETLRLRNLIDVPEETHQVLSKLADHLPLIAISNGNANPSVIGLDTYFQATLRAGPDGRAKPYPDMFTTAVNTLGLNPSSILHVGDHGRTDVLGAINYGLSACWFNDQRYNARTFSKLKVLPDIEIQRLEELLVLLR